MLVPVWMARQYTVIRIINSNLLNLNYTVEYIAHTSCGTVRYNGQQSKKEKREEKQMCGAIFAYECDNYSLIV